MRDKKNYINASVELTRVYNAELASRAKREGITKSELIRRAIEAYLNK